MLHPINFDLEKHLLNGCTIIQKESVNYDTAGGDFTHILLQCPKGYAGYDNTAGEAPKFISVEVYRGESKWFESHYYYANKAYARKRFREELAEDRRLFREIRKLEKQKAAGK